MVTGWFQSKFPKATFIFLDAGVGGTDSHYGDQRLQNDLLQYKPDFVITEWANNDGAQGMAGVAHDYGDVVDRIMGLPNEPAVIMLFTMDRDGNNAEPFETPVGYARNLPMIGMKDAIFAQQQAGDFSGEQRTADSIHPNDLGHLILATLVEQYMDRLR
ncbi:hypothetical protein KBK24_0121820 [Burkholderia sp. K24]|nr:hypothetical protein KBK24_0121820 [Burkholderia sp. K24]